MNGASGRKLRREDTEVLAIPVGVGRSEFVLTKLAELRKLPARIVRDGQIDQWRFDGVLKHEGRLYLHGPYLGGIFLEEAIQKTFSAALPSQPADPRPGCLEKPRTDPRIPPDRLGVLSR